MDAFIWVIAIISGFSTAFAITINKLKKSNELGNSESSIEQLNGSVDILIKSDKVNKNHPV